MDFIRLPRDFHERVVEHLEEADVRTRFRYSQTCRFLWQMTEHMWTYDICFPEHRGGWPSLLIQRSAEVVSEWLPGELDGPYFEDEPGATLPPNAKCWFQRGNQLPRNLSALEALKTREGKYLEAKLITKRLTAPLVRFINAHVYRIVCTLGADSLITLRCPEFCFKFEEKDHAKIKHFFTTLVSEWRAGTWQIVFGECFVEPSYIPQFMSDAILNGVITEGDRKLQIEFYARCAYRFREAS